MPTPSVAQLDRSLLVAFAGLTMTFASHALAQGVFTEDASSCGIAYPVQGSPGLWNMYGYGCGAADLDGDGDQDVIILGRSNGQVGLYENLGNGTFANRSATCGITNLQYHSGFATADYNGDGKLDICITRIQGETTRLYRGLGSFTWADATFPAGIDTTDRNSKSCAWGDYDNDGWVDLYVVNYVTANPDLTYQENQLFRNKGDGTFEEVGVQLGVNSRSYTFQAVWTDVDRDGWIDLYLSTDHGANRNIPNQLFRNIRGKFVEIGPESGTDVGLNSMGLACGDWNRDGLPDFYLTNTNPTIPETGIGYPLLLSEGANHWNQGQYVWDVAYPATMPRSGNYSTGWGCMFFDWNNDSWQDIFVVFQQDVNSLLQGGPTPPAIDVAQAAGIQGVANQHKYGCAFLDANGDGALDVVQNPMGTNARLYINHQTNPNTWVRFKVKGQWPNTAAINAQVEGQMGGQIWYQEVLAGGNGYLGQNEQVIHFGLGSASALDAATVRWPSGGPTRQLSAIPAGHQWTLYPPEVLGDGDGDGDFDAQDRALLCAWAGAVVPGRERMDMNGDWQINNIDAALFGSQHSLLMCDLNGDATVDGADLGALLGAWSTSSCLADLNGDGLVDGADLGLLLGNWG